MESYQGFKEVQGDNAMIIVMVGLPGRGKSYMSTKLSNYLKWRGFTSRIFNIGNYRRKLVGGESCKQDFFDPNNQEAVNSREECAILCLEDLLSWVENSRGIAFFDGTNSNFKRREIVMNYIEDSGINVPVIHLESICDDETIIMRNIITNKLGGPDYYKVKREEAIRDFYERIAQYMKNYNPLEETERNGNLRFVKIINAGNEVNFNWANLII